MGANLLPLKFRKLFVFFSPQLYKHLYQQAFPLREISMSSPNPDPAFHRFPNELLEEIQQYIQPEDFEEWASISRQTRLMSRPSFADHRARIRKFACLDVNIAYTGPQERLLKDVLVSPRDGSYTTNFRIQHVGIYDKRRGLVVERIEEDDMKLVGVFRPYSMNFICVWASETALLRSASPDSLYCLLGISIRPAD